MKRKWISTLAWALVVILGIGIVTDFLCELGINRGWQYIYNLASCLAAPFLIAVALRDKISQNI